MHISFRYNLKREGSLFIVLITIHNACQDAPTKTDYKYYLVVLDLDPRLLVDSERCTIADPPLNKTDTDNCIH